MFQERTEEEGAAAPLEFCFVFTAHRLCHQCSNEPLRQGKKVSLLQVVKTSLPATVAFFFFLCPNDINLKN